MNEKLWTTISANAARYGMGAQPIAETNDVKIRFVLSVRSPNGTLYEVKRTFPAEKIIYRLQERPQIPKVERLNRWLQKLHGHMKTTLMAQGLLCDIPRGLIIPPEGHSTKAEDLMMASRVVLKKKDGEAREKRMADYQTRESERMVVNALGAFLGEEECTS